MNYVNRDIINYNVNKEVEDSNMTYMILTYTTVKPVTRKGLPDKM
jgi:hypothetical protein